MATPRSTRSSRTRKPAAQRQPGPDPDPAGQPAAEPEPGQESAVAVAAGQQEPGTVLPTDYAHREAWKVMEYATDDDSEREVVWNAGDLAAPYYITLPSGALAHHVHWADAERMPEDWPNPPGLRMFVKMTPARARHKAEQQVATWWADPFTRRELHARFGDDQAAAVNALTDLYLTGPNPGPDLAEPDRPPRRAHALASCPACAAGDPGQPGMVPGPGGQPVTCTSEWHELAPAGAR